MVLNYHYTYAKKFEGKDYDEKKTFVLRLIKRELQKKIDFELSDNLFIELYNAIFLCKVEGPLGFAQLSLLQPIHRVLQRYGIENERYTKSGIVFKFFFP